MALTLQGVENLSPSSNKTLVYMATHGGELRLPFMKRSFISFSYGGKWIEDFNLIATSKGDGIERNGYAAFNDITTNNDVLDGLIHWSTHFQTNSLEFNLVSDAIDLRELEAFLNWFVPGKARELILAEHPNRAIMARVSEPPALSLAAFEKPITLTLGLESLFSYDTSTTVYRGNITLKLVMDEPFWYAKNNLLGIKHTLNGSNYYADEFLDANGNVVNILSTAGKDALKIVYEDGIPLGSMITCDMILGNGVNASIETRYYNYPANIALYIDSAVLNGSADNPYKFGFVSNGDISSDGIGALIAPASGTTYNNDLSLNNLTWIGIDSAINNGLPFYYKLVDNNGNGAVIPANKAYGRIAGAIVSDGNIDSWPSGIEGILYFYYCGTAPSPLSLTFSLKPIFSGNYITEPKNRYSENDDVYYNTITIGGDGEDENDKLVFRITAPFLYTSFNHCVKLFDLEYATSSWVEFEKTLRAVVMHPYIRWAALRIITALTPASTHLNEVSGGTATFANELKTVVFGNDLNYARFTFNSKTGEAIVKYYYIHNEYNSSSVTVENGIRILIDDAGDMLLSNKLYVIDRNLFNVNNLIDLYRNGAVNGVDRSKYSHYMIHNFNLALYDVLLEYLNLYL